MKKTPPTPAETPSIVRTALLLNLLLLAIALIVPRRFSNLDGFDAATRAALAFAIPMALILVVGTGVAIRAFILARRQDRPLRWTAFLPAGVFLLGIAFTLALVYTDFSWNSSSEATTKTSQ